MTLVAYASDAAEASGNAKRLMDALTIPISTFQLEYFKEDHLEARLFSCEKEETNDFPKTFDLPAEGEIDAKCHEIEIDANIPSNRMAKWAVFYTIHQNTEWSHSVRVSVPKRYNRWFYEEFDQKYARKVIPGKSFPASSFTSLKQRRDQFKKYFYNRFIYLQDLAMDNNDDQKHWIFGEDDEAQVIAGELTRLVKAVAEDNKTQPTVHLPRVDVSEIKIGGQTPDQASEHATASISSSGSPSPTTTPRGSPKFFKPPLPEGPPPPPVATAFEGELPADFEMQPPHVPPPSMATTTEIQPLDAAPPAAPQQQKGPPGMQPPSGPPPANATPFAAQVNRHNDIPVAHKAEEHVPRAQHDAELAAAEKKLKEQEEQLAEAEAAAQRKAAADACRRHTERAADKLVAEAKLQEQEEQLEQAKAEAQKIQAEYEAKQKELAAQQAEAEAQAQKILAAAKAEAEAKAQKIQEQAEADAKTIRAAAEVEAAKKALLEVDADLGELQTTAARFTKENAAPVAEAPKLDHETGFFAIGMSDADIKKQIQDSREQEWYINEFIKWVPLTKKVSQSVKTDVSKIASQPFDNQLLMDAHAILEKIERKGCFFGPAKSNLEIWEQTLFKLIQCNSTNGPDPSHRCLRRDDARLDWFEAQTTYIGDKKEKFKDFVRQEPQYFTVTSQK